LISKFEGHKTKKMSGGAKSRQSSFLFLGVEKKKQKGPATNQPPPTHLFGFEG
jgi:hypothetical protein